MAKSGNWLGNLWWWFYPYLYSFLADVITGGLYSLTYTAFIYLLNLFGLWQVT